MDKAGSVANHDFGQGGAITDTVRTYHLQLDFQRYFRVRIQTGKVRWFGQGQFMIAHDGENISFLQGLDHLFRLGAIADIITQGNDFFH